MAMCLNLIFGPSCTRVIGMALRGPNKGGATGASRGLEPPLNKIWTLQIWVYTRIVTSAATPSAGSCRSNTQCGQLQEQHTVRAVAGATHSAGSCRSNTQCGQLQEQHTMRAVAGATPSAVSCNSNCWIPDIYFCSAFRSNSQGVVSFEIQYSSLIKIKIQVMEELLLPIVAKCYKLWILYWGIEWRMQLANWIAPTGMSIFGRLVFQGDKVLLKVLSFFFLSIFYVGWQLACMGPALQTYTSTSICPVKSSVAFTILITVQIHGWWASGETDELGSVMFKMLLDRLCRNVRPVREWCFHPSPAPII